jgi:hypothetical protein
MSVRTKSWSLLVQNHFYKLVMWSEFWWWETDLPGTPLVMSLLQINILWFGIYRIKSDTEQQLKLVLFCLECGLKLIFLFQSMRVFVASSYFFSWIRNERKCERPIHFFIFHIRLILWIYEISMSWTQIRSQRAILFCMNTIFFFIVYWKLIIK